jgi:hypothetical protein
VPRCRNLRCPACPRCASISCNARSACIAKRALTPECFLPQCAIELDRFQCVHCVTFHCEACGVFVSAAKFSKTMQVRAARRQGNVRCIDCQCPPCTVVGCLTCQNCRNAKCAAKGTCADSFNSKQSVPRRRKMRI